MKLASLKSGRDGELIVVSKNLARAARVHHVAKTMQSAIDNWRECNAPLEDIYDRLNRNEISDHFRFEVKNCCAPLPRAYQWADGSAYVNHVELVRKARGAKMPESFWTDPLLYQGGSDTLLGATDPIINPHKDSGLDFEAEVAVIVDDVKMQITANQAKDRIILMMLVNDISLRNLIPNEMAKGFGFFQSKPSSAFSPVAVTPNELGKNWNGYRVSLPLLVSLNNVTFGSPNAGEDMTFSFPELIEHAAQTRKLSAGSIIGSGTISNENRKNGSGCIAEKRMLEKIKYGTPKTEFLQEGDCVRLEMLDENKTTIFGAINQNVKNF